MIILRHFRSLNSLLFIMTHIIQDVKTNLSTCRVTHNPDLYNKTSSSWMFKQLTLRASSSKLDCARLCLINKSCVTFMVNQKQRLCRLHGARITKLNALVNATGFVAYDTCRAPTAFGTLCTSSSECLLDNTSCLGQLCQCNAGWSYSPNDLACVRECILYGSEFTPFPNQFVASSNMAELKAAAKLEFTECAAACVAATDYKCRSLELDYSTMTCNLQNVTPYHSPTNYRTQSSFNVAYYQRHSCIKYGTMFTRFAKAYIQGYNVMILTDAQYQTPSACATACASMTNFTCMSFELDFTLNRCNLQDTTWFFADVVDLISSAVVNSDYYQRHCEYVP